ncbi:hypothetical protein BDP27DRAFT_1405422 [Rhodocollybia butyracea]|uniref:Uncharacterized protein n=1 Tax=Rhodocollybia butyracea TaxID=206335 RepID=A0A9P5PJ72_9AGAR|nr:hypothetical protein BDP27DRAFT_1405422 [Rhodocollybia butyracea]
MCLSEATLLLHLLAYTQSQLINVAEALNSFRTGLDSPIQEFHSAPFTNLWPVISKMTLPIILLLEDFFVVWRAWIIWPFNRYVKTILILLTALNAVSPMLLVELFDPLIATSVLSVDQIAFLNNTLFSPNDTMGVAVSLIVNVSTTSLIGFKAWSRKGGPWVTSLLCIYDSMAGYPDTLSCVNMKMSVVEEIISWKAASMLKSGAPMDQD